MSPRKILLFDRILGIPACFLLTPLSLLKRRKRTPAAASPRRIVFVKLIEMGSTVLACPAFREAAELVGKDNLYFLAFARNRPIVDILPYFRPENVITIDDTNLWTFVSGLFAARRRLRHEGVDAAVDMEGLTRSSAVITYLTGCAVRVDFHNFTNEGPYRGRLFTRELNYTFQHHVSESFLALVRSLKAVAGQVPLLKDKVSVDIAALPRFSPNRKEQENVSSMLAEAAGRSLTGRLVLLNPNCSDLLPLRRWPLDNFVELGQQILAGVPEATIVITGGRGETEEAALVAARIGTPPRVVSLAGRTTMRELLTLYTLGALLVTNDSGPCHFASLTSLRVIALFGPETPLLYSPLGDRARCIVAGLACSPCVNLLNHRFSPCTDNACMAAIPVPQVLDAAMEILASDLPP